MKKYIFAGILFLIIFSCKKEDIGINAVYLYTVSGLGVSLENYSENAISYDWDFGDGTEHSTLKSPVHKYTSVGNYTITLKATDVKGQMDSFEDVVAIYGPTIEINGDFSDWADLPYVSDNLVNADGLITKIKVWGDTRAKSVSMYIEGNSNFNKLGKIEFYINSDGNHKTGWATGWWNYSGSGLEIVLAGDFNGSNTSLWPGKYQQTVDQSWSQPQEISGATSPKFSDLKKNGDGWAFEMKIDKSFLEASLPSGIKLGNNITFGIIAYDNNWNLISSAPKQWSKNDQIKVNF